jgi:hypothetical protein
MIFLKPGMWIDEMERNNHTKIQDQTYFCLKDEKLAKSLSKEENRQNIV